MAIASGTVDVYNEASPPQQVLTKSVTVAAGSNRLLTLCWITHATTNFSSITSIVFNGSESFSYAGTTVQASQAQKVMMQFWYLVNPTVTTANIVVTFAQNNADVTEDLIITQYTGVDQTTPIDNDNAGNGWTNSGTGTTASVDVTTTTNNAWIQDVASAYDFLTVGANQTQIASFASSASSIRSSVVQGKAVAGTETMDWTLASAQWAIGAIVLRPAASSVISRPMFRGS